MKKLTAQCASLLLACLLVLASTICFPAAASADPIRTTLTSNSYSLVAPTGDANETTKVSLCSSLGDTCYWNPILSLSSLNAKNPKDIGDAIVTFKKGLNVTFLTLGNKKCKVTLTGEIVDNGTSKPFTNESLGIFKCGVSQQ